MTSQAAAPWLTPETIATAKQIARGYLQAFGRPLIAPSNAPLAQELFAAAIVVLAHDGRDLNLGEGPRLIYANRPALSLWGRPWAEMVGMPSKDTAEPAEQASRQQALSVAQHHNAISGYSGIRIDRQGRRFQINRARLWTLWAPSGEACGQAACFSDWWWLAS